MDVFVSDVSAYLPNAPVGNAEMEEILGMVGQVPSRTRAVILRSNRIRTRHYALDPETGRPTHSNAQLTAAAVRRLAPEGGLALDLVECLCCGTSSPDQIMPGHASMVHGELGGGPCEVVSTAGVCTSGMSAFKYAALSVAAGNSRNAVATGSELASTFLHAALCGPVDAGAAEQVARRPVLAFEADFLRWMLSDGAGAAYLTDRPRSDRPCLQVEWIEQVSYAHELEPCMYAGAQKLPDGSLRGWRDYPGIQAADTDKAFLIKQDVKLLNREIVSVAVDRTIPRLVAKYGLGPQDVTWFLPHYSSDFFRRPLLEHLAGVDFEIPPERWFTNLPDKGNTGAASIYIILEELLHSDRLQRGDRLLCFVPESGRFSICYMLLRVV